MPVHSAGLLRRAFLALGGGSLLAVLMAGLVGVLLLIPIGWYQSDRAARLDASRCPFVDRYAKTQVGLGGWASPDQCSYYEADGTLAQFDATMAGPITRRGQGVADLGLPAAGAGLAIVGCLVALHVVVFGADPAAKRT